MTGTMAATPSILLLHPSTFYTPSEGPPIEIKTPLLLLASYLAERFEVTYEDFEVSVGRPCSPAQIRRYERHVREYFERHPFDILAISCWTSLSFTATMACARIFRELYPDRLIVVGGYHPSARPKDFLTPDNLIDYVVVGEGEIALGELAERYSLTGCPDHTSVVAGRSLAPDELVGHDWDTIDHFVNRHFSTGLSNLYLFLSRGCPFRCSFCMESLKEGGWRAYSPEHAMREIVVGAERHKPHAIAFADACFGMRPGWRKEFLRLLAEYAPPFWIVFETRAEYLDDDDIELLARLPRLEIQFGLESASPQMLGLMHKTKRPEKYLERFRHVSDLLNQHGILHRANMIFNHPGETRATLEETFAFIDERLAIDRSYLMWAYYGFLDFPGCEIDRNRTFFETTFGSRFLSSEWWRADSDQTAASQASVPSSDLDGANVDLWERMAALRKRRMQECLAPRAFAFAALKYSPEWQDDPRYAEAKKTLVVS
ncbi:MAG: radical SAM protein [Candidatus Zixiibacteriota bacterium]